MRRSRRTRGASCGCGSPSSYEPIVDEAHAVEPLHSLRISAKRLRYTLELFRAVFGEPGDENIVRVKAIQEELGNLHDTDVRIALIQEELIVLAAEQVAGVSRSLAAAPSSAHDAIATSALRPPPDDPRRGLLSLLGRQYTARQEFFMQFNDLWHQFETEGMRSALAAMSSTASR